MALRRRPIFPSMSLQSTTSRTPCRISALFTPTSPPVIGAAAQLAPDARRLRAWNKSIGTLLTLFKILCQKSVFHMPTSQYIGYTGFIHIKWFNITELDCTGWTQWVNKRNVQIFIFLYFALKNCGWDQLYRHFLFHNLIKRYNPIHSPHCSGRRLKMKKSVEHLHWGLDP